MKRKKRHSAKVGGAEFMAAHIANFKKQNPLNVAVGAGDSIGASPLISSLFYDEPSVETLNRIELEFNSVGIMSSTKAQASCCGCKTAAANCWAAALAPTAAKA